MSITYLDTSALIKRYVHESGNADLDDGKLIRND